jgi:hypothetical protein
MPILYVPLLKAKGGEFAALKELDPAVQARVFPVFDVTDIPWDFENDSPGKTVDEHLAKIAENVFKSIGALPCAFDLTCLDPTTRMASGTHPLTWLFDDLRKKGVIARPVIGPGYDAAYLTAAAAEIATDRRGCVVRVVGQARVFDPAIATNLASVLGAVKLTEADADLLLDLQSVPSGSEHATALASAAVIHGLPSMGAWREFIISAAGFPRDLSDYGQGLFVIPRTCLITWDAMRSRGVARLLVFGDYAIDNHDRAELDINPRLLKGSTNVRYTVRTDWLVPKGPNWKDNGFAPMRGLCAQLVADARFAGAAFSWGDAYIVACANGGPTGSATTWRKVGVNHHVTFVVNQISSLHVASVGPGRRLVGPGATPLP